MAYVSELMSERTSGQWLRFWTMIFIILDVIDKQSFTFFVSYNFS